MTRALRRVRPGNERGAREVRRVHAILATSSVCRRQTLVREFGEDANSLDEGGVGKEQTVCCDVCSGYHIKSATMPQPTKARFARSRKRMRMQNNAAGSGCRRRHGRQPKYPCACGGSLRIVMPRDGQSFQPFRGCSLWRRTKCPGKRELSPEGWRHVDRRVQAAQPARAFFGLHGGGSARPIRLGQQWGLHGCARG